MKRFSITIEWGKVEAEQEKHEMQADALVERSDPERPPNHDLDGRRMGFVPERAPDTSWVREVDKG